ncbi:MAG: hypothetical protein WBW67_23860 [Pseudolabrys sp.]
MNIIEKSRETVEQLLARCSLPKTFPIGTKVKMRLLHNFHIRDGMIAKEIGYEIWRRDE